MITFGVILIRITSRLQNQFISNYVQYLNSPVFIDVNVQLYVGQYFIFERENICYLIRISKLSFVHKHLIFIDVEK